MIMISNAPIAKHRPVVAQLINSLSMAGAEALACTLARSLARDIVSLVVAMGPSKDGMERQIEGALEEAGVKVFRLEKPPGRRSLKAIRELRGILRKESVNLLHTHCESPDTFGRLSCLGLPVRHVTTLHNHNPWAGRKRMGWVIERLLKHRTRCWIACSPGMDRARAFVGAETKRSRCIPNGIEIGKYRRRPAEGNKWRDRLGLPRDSMLLVTVGRISYQKGHDVLAEAIELIRRHFPKAYFLWAGATDVEPAHFVRVREAVRSRHQSDCVHFMGPIQDIPGLLSAADLVISPSRWEGLSLALLEAMASGVPIVATEVATLRETLPPEAHHWLVPPGDFEALAVKVVSLLGDLETQAAIARGPVRARAAESFSQDRMLGAYLDVYSEILGNWRTAQ